MTLLGPISPKPSAEVDGPHDLTEAELKLLFHRLNNQLGIVLAHAELLEAKALDDAASRARAQQLIASVVDALGTAREIREKTTS